MKKDDKLTGFARMELRKSAKQPDIHAMREKTSYQL